MTVLELSKYDYEEIRHGPTYEDIKGKERRFFSLEL